MLLLTNISQLVTMVGSASPRRGNDLSELGLVKDAAVLCDGNRILAAGNQGQILKHSSYKNNRHTIKTIDCKNKIALPGFVDSHTHLIFSGPRLVDFEKRISGASYEQIAAEGGGIQSSVAGVRDASEANLAERALHALRQMLACGTTTVEAKSGYGLNLAAEMKTLRAIHRAARKWPGTVVSTLLGAHVVPAEYQGRRAAYIKLVCEKMIPQAAQKDLATFVDVFCERGAFSLEESRQVFAAAARHGLQTRAHVGQFSTCSLSPLLKSQPASLDHLDHISSSDIARLASTNTVATLVPGANYFLGHKKYPDARRLVSSGVAVSLATDYNPGTSPTLNMQFILSLACTQMKMTPAEAISASTINGAHALRLADSKGSVETGKDADLAIFDVCDYRELGYWFGSNLCTSTLTKGKVTRQSL